MDGSINRFGVAEGSQCDYDEPGWTGLGALSRTCPSGLAPAMKFGSRISFDTLLPGNTALMRSPSSLEIPTEGIVTKDKDPPMGGLPIG